MIRLFMVDDHAIVRAGLRDLTTADPEITLVGESASVSDLMQHLEREPCDVVLLDVSLAGESGLDALPRIRSAHPDTKVLILSMYSEAEYSIRALRLGASGYLTKETAPDQLLDAIRKVASGGRYVSPELGEQLAARLQGECGAPHERLSNREFQILRLIGEGKRLTDIAELLGSSVKTVSTHRRRILDKMNLETTAQLIRYVIDNRISDGS